MVTIRLHRPGAASAVFFNICGHAVLLGKRHHQHLPSLREHLATAGDRVQPIVVVSLVDGLGFVGRRFGEGRRAGEW
jgi:hypothetical protein